MDELHVGRRHYLLTDEHDERSHDPGLRERGAMLKSRTGGTRDVKVSGVGLYGSGRKSHGGSSRGREKCSTDKLNGKGYKCARALCLRAAPRRYAPIRSARNARDRACCIQPAINRMFSQRKKEGRRPSFISPCRAVRRIKRRRNKSFGLVCPFPPLASGG